MVQGHCSLHIFHEEQCKPDRVNDKNFTATKLTIDWETWVKTNVFTHQNEKNLCEVWARISQGEK